MVKLKIWSQFFIWIGTSKDKVFSGDHELSSCHPSSAIMLISAALIMASSILITSSSRLFKLQFRKVPERLSLHLIMTIPWVAWQSWPLVPPSAHFSYISINHLHAEKKRRFYSNILHFTYASSVFYILLKFSHDRVMFGPPCIRSSSPSFRYLWDE